MVFMGFSHPTEVTKEQQNYLWVLSPVLPEPPKVQMSHKSARCQAARRELRESRNLPPTMPGPHQHAKPWGRGVKRGERGGRPGAPGTWHQRWGGGGEEDGQLQASRNVTCGPASNVSFLTPPAHFTCSFCPQAQLPGVSK